MDVLRTRGGTLIPLKQTGHSEDPVCHTSNGYIKELENYIVPSD